MENRGKVRARQAAYYARNKEKVRARQAAYRVRNKEKTQARQVAYVTRNKEKVRAYQAAYRVRNKEKTQARQAAYVARNREKVRAQKSASYLSQTYGEYAEVVLLNRQLWQQIKQMENGHGPSRSRRQKVPKPHPAQGRANLQRSQGVHVG